MTEKLEIALFPKFRLLIGVKYVSACAYWGACCHNKKKVILMYVLVNMKFMYRVYKTFQNKSTSSLHVVSTSLYTWSTFRARSKPYKCPDNIKVVNKRKVMKVVGQTKFCCALQQEWNLWDGDFISPRPFISVHCTPRQWVLHWTCIGDQL